MVIPREEIDKKYQSSGWRHWEKYGKTCDCATIHVHVTRFKYESTEQFAKGEYSDIYKDRIHISERVNAYLKGLTGMFHVKGRNFKAAKIQIILTCLLHNIIRLENLKGTFYL